MMSYPVLNDPQKIIQAETLGKEVFIEFIVYLRNKTSVPMV